MAIKASRTVLFPYRLSASKRRSNLFSARAQGEEADLSGEVRTGYEPTCKTLHSLANRFCWSPLIKALECVWSMQLGEWKGGAVTTQALSRISLSCAVAGQLEPGKL